MRVFIDERGSFSGFHAGSLSVVGALVIPDVMMEKIGKKSAKFRDKLPQEKGEVKGRLLNEKQVDKVVTLLVRNEALFEITALDLGLHQENAVREYQKKLGEQMLAKVANFREDVRPEVQAASDYILKPPVNLFLQANVVNEGFSSDGRLMLTKRNLRLALTAQDGRPLMAV